MRADPVTLTSPDEALSATFLTGLGMVCSSLTHDGEELLAQRGGAEEYAASGAGFGIPILHPWANRLSEWEYRFDGRTVTLDSASPISYAEADGHPLHGVLAACPDWTLTDVSATALEARLDFGADPLRAAAFPFPHTLIYSAAVSETGLAIALALEATSDIPVPVAFGFHPFLALPGSDRQDWILTMPVAQGELDGPLGEESFDDGFTELQGDPPLFCVQDDRRQLSVVFTRGYPVAQVFAQSGHVGPGADLICFEPMTAPINALRTGEGLRTVAPGEVFTAVFAIQVARQGDGERS